MSDAWRLLQAVGVSVLIAVAVIAASDGIIIRDTCEICLEVHPWWWCTLVMMCW